MKNWLSFPAETVAQWWRLALWSMHCEGHSCDRLKWVFHFWYDLWSPQDEAPGSELLEQGMWIGKALFLLMRLGVNDVLDSMSYNFNLKASTGTPVKLGPCWLQMCINPYRLLLRPVWGCWVSSTHSYPNYTHNGGKIWRGSNSKSSSL